MAKHIDKNKKNTTKKVKETKEKKSSWIRESVAELKRVQWPTASETWHASLAVLATIVLFGLVIFVMDIGFVQLVDFWSEF